jgi:serine/threonine protein phosphatase 1
MVVLPPWPVYHVISVAEMPKDHLTWLQTLPTDFDDGQRYFVHAGIRPGAALDQQTREDMPWIREPFLSWTGDFSRLVTHSHTPVEGSAPDVRPNRVIWILEPSTVAQ